MKKIFALVIILSLCFTMLCSCKKKDNDEIEVPIYDISSHAFKTHTVKPESFEDVFFAKGSIGYLNVTAIKFSGNDGVIYSVYKNVGDTVKQGETILTITNSEVSSEYESQKTKVELARLNLEGLKQSGASVYEIQSAEADYKIEQVKLEDKKNALDAYTIKAPFDGVIQNLCDSAKGVSVSKGTNLCTIAEADSLCVYFNGDGTKNFRYGQQVTVTCDKNTATGKVVSTPSDAPNGSNGNSAKAVVISLDNVDLKTWVDVNKVAANIGAIKDKNLTNPTLMSNADIKLVKDSRENVLTVPKSAVAYKNEQPYVYVYKNGAKIQTFVETGLITSTTVEVTKGLIEGDEVILGSEASSNLTFDPAQAPQ